MIAVDAQSGLALILRDELRDVDVARQHVGVARMLVERSLRLVERDLRAGRRLSMPATRSRVVLEVPLAIAACPGRSARNS